MEHPHQDTTGDSRIQRCSTTTVKTTLLLLNLGFNCQLKSALHYSYIDLPKETQKPNPTVVGTKLSGPTFSVYHHLGLPLQRQLQPRQPINIQRLEILCADLVHPDTLLPRRFLPQRLQLALGFSQHQSPQPLLPQRNVFDSTAPTCHTSDSLRIWEIFSQKWESNTSHVEHSARCSQKPFTIH